MKIYFETGPLHSLIEFVNMLPPTIITSMNGYRNMIIDAKTALHNKWDIYTNDISLLGSKEVFGDKFLHKIMIRDDDTPDKWIELNPQLVRKLETPINVEQYFRRFICK